MEIVKKIEGDALLVKLTGSFDTVGAPTFDEEFKVIDEGIKTIEIDMAEVGYMSSAGLRSLVNLYKKTRGTSQMVIANVNNEVKEVFDLTGFGEIFSFK